MQTKLHNLAWLAVAIIAAAVAWTAKGADYRDAVVQVAGAGQGVQPCGSGVVIDDAGHVLTAAHVVSELTDGQVRITWRNGAVRMGEVLGRDDAADVAIIRTAAAAVYIPLAEEQQFAPPGATVELIGYGGGQFRHWQAHVRGYALKHETGLWNDISLATQTIGGDSGGAIIHNGKLVAIIWGGPTAGEQGPMLATHGVSAGPIRRLVQRFCPGGQCPTQPMQPMMPMRPRSPMPQSIPARPQNCPLPAPPPQSPPQPDTGLQVRIGQLESRIAQLEQHQPKGCECDQEALLERLKVYVDARTSENETAVIDWLEANRESLRGPKGEQGEAGQDGNGADLSAEKIDALIGERIRQKLRIEVEHKPAGSTE